MLNRLCHFRGILHRSAYKILGAYTLLLLAVPPVILLPLGITIWILMAAACTWALFTPSERPSFIATFTFFLFFTFEVIFAASPRLP
jgi:hypothetical protein